MSKAYYVPPSREGKVAVTFFTDTERRHWLRQTALDTGRPVQEILESLIDAARASNKKDVNATQKVA